MRVLIAYGSTRGGTEGLAHMLADGLRDGGLAVDVLPAREARVPGDYDAVIVGGALYALRWHRDARRFMRRHMAELREHPLWLFSSGPLDDSATAREIPPVARVATLMAQSGARGHVTFGGRLAADARGFPASAMAKNHAGDWRDPAQVKEWAQAIATDLLGPEKADGARPGPGARP